MGRDMDRLVIGLLGLEFSSGNKGCEALSYGFLEILNRIAKNRNKRIKVYLIKKLPTKSFCRNFFSLKKTKELYRCKNTYEYLETDIIFLFHSSQNTFLSKEVKRCDYVIDFTGGDSFSDIYGMSRFLDRTHLKLDVIRSGIPLILGSQTIGPFYSEQAQKLASEVIKKSYAVFVRDEFSRTYTRELIGRDPILTTDVAFALPYQKMEISKTDKIKIGFNPSGLLWNGGYTGNNQFNLSVDYRLYCEKIIFELIKDGRYEVHLILHSYEDNNTNIADNDLVPVKLLHEKFPETIVPRFFTSCMDAKNYIASLDILIAARMHATIGAFSSGVPVIPFSYSRKFEGLFFSLKYPYVLEATKLNTDECIDQTFLWINQLEKLKSEMIYGNNFIREKLDLFENTLERLLEDNT